jgi:hypothetical protein
VSEPVHEDETGDPVRVYVPAPAGAVVGAVCVYEVVAIAERREAGSPRRGRVAPSGTDAETVLRSHDHHAA